MARERKFSEKVLFDETKGLLLEYGYEAFTFSLLAERLKVARGTIYKYYETKDELITEYMLFEMRRFLLDLKQIHEQQGFELQFDFLLKVIHTHGPIHRILESAQHIPKDADEKVKKNKEQLDFLHMEMYKSLQAFLLLGREEKLLNPELPDGLILGMIFQTINIPNHFRIPEREWARSIKHILCHGMLIKRN